MGVYLRLRERAQWAQESGIDDEFVDGVRES